MVARVPIELAVGYLEMIEENRRRGGDPGMLRQLELDIIAAQLAELERQADGDDCP